MPEARLLYLLEKFHIGGCIPDEMQVAEKWFGMLAHSDEAFVENDAEAIKEEMLQQFRARLAGRKDISSFVEKLKTEM